MGETSATRIRGLVDSPATRTATLPHRAATVPKLFANFSSSPPPPRRHRPSLLSPSPSIHNTPETSVTNAPSTASAADVSNDVDPTSFDRQHLRRRTQLPPFPVRDTPRKHREPTCSHLRYTRRPSRMLRAGRTRQIPSQDLWNLAVHICFELRSSRYVLHFALFSTKCTEHYLIHRHDDAGRWTGWVIRSWAVEPRGQYNVRFPPLIDTSTLAAIFTALSTVLNIHRRRRRRIETNATICHIRHPSRLQHHHVPSLSSTSSKDSASSTSFLPNSISTHETVIRPLVSTICVRNRVVHVVQASIRPRRRLLARC